MARVISIHRYPVKSMAGEDLEEATLGERGLPGDRAWAVRDEVRGGIRGAKKLPRLMECAARYEKAPAPEGSSPAEITLPGGETLHAGEFIGSGTVGSGCGLELGRFLKHGDLVELEIEGLGILRNRVVDRSAGV